ncbi:MAG: serine/threonine protein kinase, partial [Myxococcales bacterium]|nr:serine/threonine protein kinase [Myxococcales bacterium]
MSERDPLSGTAYRSVRRIGRGDLFEALHLERGTSVAVKLLGGPAEGSPERMQLEARVLCRIDDPRIVDVFDVGETSGGQIFYAMELLEGRTLAEELKARRRLPLREARRVMLEVLDGLSALHREGLVHRDLKPSNVFYCTARGDRPRAVKLLELGVMKLSPAPGKAIAALLRPRSARPASRGAAMLTGSPRYLSPEQARGEEVDARSDVYAAGLLLYELITGRGPFHDRQGVGGALVAHIRDAPLPPSAVGACQTGIRERIPPELDRLVL